jgi:hypothetical protein
MISLNGTQTSFSRGDIRIDTRGGGQRQSRTEQTRHETPTRSLTRPAQTGTTNQQTSTTPTPGTTPGNPFSGQTGGTTAPATPAAPAYAAPTIAPPPAMSSRPGSISLSTSVDSVISNSARSVQITNHAYNEQAYESYNKAVKEWQENNGRRWVGNQFVQTTVPPPTPDYLPVDFGEIYTDISANYQQGRPYEDVNAKRPYYMGGSVYIKS